LLTKLIFTAKQACHLEECISRSRINHTTYVWRRADLNPSLKRSNDLQILYYSSTNKRIKDSGTQNEEKESLNLSFASLPVCKYIDKICET
jgi:hypothetical protein